MRPAAPAGPGIKREINCAAFGLPHQVAPSSYQFDHHPPFFSTRLTFFFKRKRREGISNTIIVLYMPARQHILGSMHLCVSLLNPASNNLFFKTLNNSTINNIGPHQCHVCSSGVPIGFFARLNVPCPIHDPAFHRWTSYTLLFAIFC